MAPQERSRPTINGILDALATRVGLTLSLVGLALICFLAGVNVERSVKKLDDYQHSYNDRLIRNGFVSLSDIQRLLLSAQEAVEKGEFTAEGEQAFIQASDFLFVRTKHFRRTLLLGEPFAPSEDAVSAMEAMLDVSERAVATGLVNVPGLWDELLATSDDTRRKLVIFLEEMARLQNALMLDQSRAVREQRTVVLASLLGLTFVGIAALLLLRREVLGRQARDRAERDVEFLAYFDKLTELPNRAQFQSRLDKSLTKHEPVALILVDVDDFKTINDTYGHAAGDTVLRHVGKLLSAQVEASDGFAARIGGDEFAIVLPTDDLDELTRKCNRLLQEARKGLSYEGETFHVGLSIGFATSTLLGQDLSPSVDTICRVADFALYSSKSNGRGRFTQYDETLEKRFLERQSMVDDLPHAIAEGELAIYLQPKVYLPNGTPYGFEALVRWKRNGRVVPPDEFIKVAEECGLIYEIDRYVLRSATRLLAEYNHAHQTAYSVSVNLSALHFNSRRIIGWVEEALNTSDLAPGLITLEITETAELRDWQEAQSIMSELRELGTKISIDDFGTGYSSLGYLRSTVVDEVKIDRSIIDRIETCDKARFLLDGVLDMASNLGLVVVVEGVENSAQAKTLDHMGAARAQGFLFGHPVPAEQALGGLPHVAGDAEVGYDRRANERG
ncbi:putative bifunctional diguanylate cyclase/phosphodiesterase [Roseobacter weihaiensis]|uniref:putative bifunctional diguanylate cyclase/phosphodiesterase n=1 Tax=Roseobacter weihaiensis TaxID=2763262 RepID=UPI001D0BD7CB|nr:EAL domain-containing protein [Roseobacter sp. H9]